MCSGNRFGRGDLVNEHPGTNFCVKHYATPVKIFLACSARKAVYGPARPDFQICIGSLGYMMGF